MIKQIGIGARQARQFLSIMLGLFAVSIYSTTSSADDGPSLYQTLSWLERNTPLLVVNDDYLSVEFEFDVRDPQDPNLRRRRDGFGPYRFIFTRPKVDGIYERSVTEFRFRDLRSGRFLCTGASKGLDCFTKETAKVVSKKWSSPGKPGKELFLPEIGWGIDFRDQGDADRYARAIRRAIELSQTASDDLF